jgi:hypothetical protein
VENKRISGKQINYRHSSDILFFTSVTAVMLCVDSFTHTHTHTQPYMKSGGGNKRPQKKPQWSFVWYCKQNLCTAQAKACVLQKMSAKASMLSLMLTN